MSEGTQPAYLIASPRSGSNLLRSILGSHPDVAAPPPFEATIPHTLPGLPRKLQTKLIRDILISQTYSAHNLQVELQPSAVRHRMRSWSYFDLQRALYEEYANAVGASVWMTRYAGPRFSRVRSTIDNYEDVKIVYLVRDARDVALSMKSAKAGPYDPYLGAVHWMIEQSIGKEVIEDCDLNTSVVMYEDLLRSPREEVRQLCEALGVEFTGEVFSYHQQGGVTEMANDDTMYENISKPIIADNYGKFHDGLSDSEIAVVEKVTSVGLDYFGYELQNSSEALANLQIADEDEYARRNRAIRRQFLLKECKRHPIQLAKYALWENYTAFLQFRYGTIHGA